MIIFLRNIPATTRINEISEFIEPVVKRSLFKLFRESGFIDNIKILALKDNNLNLIEYHGLVTIYPHSVGERVIKLLNRQIFKGKHITVREYVKRSWHNDRRIIASDSSGNLENQSEKQKRIVTGTGPIEKMDATTNDWPADD